MIVYIVFQGEYDDEHIEGVFEDRADAQKFADEITAKKGYFKNGQLVGDGGFIREWLVTPSSVLAGSVRFDR